MQSNSHSRNREIPIDGYFGEVASLYFWTDNWQTKKTATREPRLDGRQKAHNLQPLLFLISRTSAFGPQIWNFI